MVFWRVFGVFSRVFRVFDGIFGSPRICWVFLAGFSGFLAVLGLFPGFLGFWDVFWVVFSPVFGGFFGVFRGF